MSINTPIYRGLAQSDLDMAGFDLLNWSGGGGGGGDGAPARKFDVKTYGALGDGTTDDTTAIQAALTAIPATGGVLYFPAGQYRYAGATLALDRQITVEGDGGGVQFTYAGASDLAITTIDFNSSTGTLFTVTASGCAFKNLELRNTSGTTPSAGAGILVSSNGDQTSYQSITVDGFYIDIDVQTGAAQDWEGCYITNPVLYGLKLRNIPVPDFGDHAITNCSIYGGNSRGGTSAIRIESGGGTKIVNTKINSYPGQQWVNGIDVAVANSVITSDLLISNCSIENFSANGIKGTTGTGGATYNNIIITGNQIFTPSGGTYGINLAPSTAGGFNGVTISGNIGNSTSSNAMIAISNCSGVMLTGNSQYGFGGGVVAIGSGVTFADSPVYIGRDARLVAVSGGVKLEARNTGTDTWVEAARWTNP